MFHPEKPGGDESEYEPVEQLSLTEFRENRELLAEAHLLIQLKGFNRHERLSRRKEQETEKQSGSNEPRAISAGGLFITKKIGQGTASLDQIGFVRAYSLPDSRGVLNVGDKILIGCVDAVMCLDTELALRKFDIDSPWLAFIHGFALSPSKEKVTIVSSGFDRLIEVFLEDGRVSREWIAWDNGFNKSKMDQRTIISTGKVRDRGIEPLVVNSADFPGGLGLPPNLRTAFPNSAEYLSEDELLVTLFHRGLVKIDLNTGRTVEIDSNLMCPHSIGKINDEYVLADTRRGRAVFYSPEFKKKKVLDFSTMAQLPVEANGQEWLQYIGLVKEGVLIAVDSNRTSIYIIDLQKKEYRSLSYQDNWVVQEVQVIGNAVI